MDKKTMDKLTCCVLAFDIVVLIAMNVVYMFNPIMFNVLRAVLVTGMIIGYVMWRKTQKMFYQEKES